jgi:hypothetical protein
MNKCGYASDGAECLEGTIMNVVSGDREAEAATMPVYR